MIRFLIAALVLCFVAGDLFAQCSSGRCRTQQVALQPIRQPGQVTPVKKAPAQVTPAAVIAGKVTPAGVIDARNCQTCQNGQCQLGQCQSCQNGQCQLTLAGTQGFNIGTVPIRNTQGQASGCGSGGCGQSGCGSGGCGGGGGRRRLRR